MTFKYSATKAKRRYDTLNLRFTILYVSQWPFYADEHKFNLLFVQLPLASTLFFSYLDLLTPRRQVFVSTALPQQ